MGRGVSIIVYASGKLDTMGRLTLNILLSFAQFEREIISERVKDKMGAARKKGKYIGGKTILGYDADRANRKLVINKEEAKLVHMIFDLYVELKSFLKVAMVLNDKGYRTKRYVTKSGKVTGDTKFKNTNIQLMLQYVLYTGRVKYNGELYPGLHEAIISEETFNKVRQIIASNRVRRDNPKNTRTLASSTGSCAVRPVTALCSTPIPARKITASTAIMSA